MLKKTITFTDYNGVERTEDFYFNLTKAELAEMNLSTTGGMDKMINDIIAAQDAPKIAALFKDILLRSYGEKSPDGRRFIKSPELSLEFSQTEAYSDLYMELMTDETAEKITAFINGVLPSEVTKSADPKLIKRN